MHNDILAEFIRARRADDFVNGILYNGCGKSGGNVLDGRTVLLRFLDGGVHKYRASRSEFDGSAGEKTFL